MRLNISIDTSKVSHDKQHLMVADVLAQLAMTFMKDNAHFDAVNHDQNGNWGACRLCHDDIAVGSMELLK